MNSKTHTEFQRRNPIYQQLLGEVRFILENGLKKEGIRTHATGGRIKNYDSFKKKVERLNAKNPFDDVTDLVGVRVICLLRSDIPKVGNLIRASFSVRSEDNKIDGQEVSSFGYQSIHFLATIKPEYKGPRYDSIKDITFEIQVRTIAMDAWATVSHYLDYKSDYDVPKHMRKDFYALSGLFYVVDTHFELFYQAGVESRNSTLERLTNKKSVEGEELNIDTLRAYIARKITDHHIPESDTEGYSELVRELVASGYRQISEIDSAIDRGMAAFLAYEKQYPPHGDKGKRDSLKYNAIGVVRGLMSIFDEDSITHRKNKVEDNTYEKFRHLVKPA